MTDAVVKEFGVVQPLGCETKTLVVPVPFNVMGNVVVLLPGAIVTVVGTVATAVLPLETATFRAKPPASDCGPTGVFELSSNAVNTLTELIEPEDSGPETLCGNRTTADGANCTVPTAVPKLAVDTV